MHLTVVLERLVTFPFLCCFQVPAAVSHLEFWQRYFYKVHRLEQVGGQVGVALQQSAAGAG